MSIVTLKRKGVIEYGSKRSGKSTVGYWLPQGPFGSKENSLKLAENTGRTGSGFALNGSHRNIGYVGKTYQMSKNGTPFRGIHPYGNGGHVGNYKYTEPIFNVNETIVLGNQEQYIKPSVLSTKGMLAKKYRWIHSGQYPNFWVQPNYGGTVLSDTKSQGNFIHDKVCSNMCVTDINNTDKYIGHIVRGGPTLCQTSAVKFKYNDMSANAPYAKRIHQPEDSSQRTLRIQRHCTNPNKQQQPFPYATNGDACNAHYELNATATNARIFL
jgi:hypothetical protein